MADRMSLKERLKPRRAAALSLGLGWTSAPAGLAALAQELPAERRPSASAWMASAGGSAADAGGVLHAALPGTGTAAGASTEAAPHGLPGATHPGSGPSHGSGSGFGKPQIEHANPLARTLLAKLDYDQLTNCMRCGFCLPACPTFRETGIEPESPRGRIALMKAVADGLMDPDESFRAQMNHCLGCRACEPACPADVKYGQLIEQARDALEDHSDHNVPVKGVRAALFRGVFPKRGSLRALGGALALYQKSGLRRVARGAGIMKLFPAPIREMEEILPDASSRGVIERIGTYLPAQGESLGRVALFRGCIMDVLFAGTNVNTAELLAQAGYDVVIPREQACCGALHAHSGELDQARGLARRNLEAFRDGGIEWIVSNAGGCGAQLVEYGHLLQDDPDYAELAQAFAVRVVDVSRLLVASGRLPLEGALQAAGEAAAAAWSNSACGGGCSSALGTDPAAAGETGPPVRVTYQDSCHLRNGMKGSSEPRQLIRQTGGVEFVEMRESDRCCGSAGIYNVLQPEMAGQLLEHKMEHAGATGASYLLTSNPGCLLQMKLGVHKHGDPATMKVMHVVDFLHERVAAGKS
ncbi:(Fe-S)-binding protein [Paenibacillus sp. FSL W8-1187]|uniref:(Fe-S)-binding protein n=1 Tax=Paenibacillus sp. FSL W8-1187 TaxID=2975339 RepID=UPI0030DBF899